MVRRKNKQEDEEKPCNKYFLLRLSLVIFILISSIGFYRYYWEVDFEVSDYTLEKTVPYVNTGRMTLGGSRELNVFYNSINALAKIPSALDYKQICFTNWGYPETSPPNLPFDYTREDAILKIRHAAQELIIPMEQTKCTQFKGDDFQYTWEFVSVPQHYQNVNLTFRPYSPEIELIEGEIPLKDYTYPTTTLEPISAVLRMFLLWSVLCGFILLGNSVYKYVWYGNKK